MVGEQVDEGSDSLGLISWKDLNKRDVKEPPFSINPYIVEQGITFLWAATSSGKSPISWEMAASIGNGSHFFGLPCKKGKVLYLEVDSPEVVLATRVRKREAADNVWFLTMKPLSVPALREEEFDALKEAQEELCPDVVFLNTLRKLHKLDDKDSTTPVTVYSYFQHLFPQASLVFIHHTRKAPTDPRFVENEKENFSGSMHFLDDAQVGLYLEKYADPKGRFNLRLQHKKTQVSKHVRPLPLKLHDDGTTMSSPLYEDMLKVYTMLHESGKKGGDLDDLVAKELSVSTSTARRRRLAVEEGRFPGSRAWLEEEL